MEIIATTSTGVLIQATGNEVKEILNAVTGNRPEKLEIGQRIPAIDYASTITKVKELRDSYHFKNVLEHAKKFNKELEGLVTATGKAGDLEL